MATRFGVDLPATVTFDHPTPAALAAFVHSVLPAPVTEVETASELAGVSADLHAVPSARGRRLRRQAAAHPSQGTSTQHQALETIMEQLQSVVAGVLGATVPPEQPLMEAGLDSLGECRRSSAHCAGRCLVLSHLTVYHVCYTGAVELRNAISSSFDLQPPATLTFDYPTLASLAAYVAEHVQPEETSGSLGDAWEVLPSDTMAHSPDLAPWSALVAVSCRYPSTNSSSGSCLLDLAPASATAGQGNADLAGFTAAVLAASNQPTPVPVQRWDIEHCYHPGEREH